MRLNRTPGICRSKIVECENRWALPYVIIQSWYTLRLNCDWIRPTS